MAEPIGLRMLISELRIHVNEIRLHCRAQTHLGTILSKFCLSPRMYLGSVRKPGNLEETHMTTANLPTARHPRSGIETDYPVCHIVNVKKYSCWNNVSMSRKCVLNTFFVIQTLLGMPWMTHHTASTFTIYETSLKQSHGWIRLPDTVL